MGETALERLERRLRERRELQQAQAAQRFHVMVVDDEVHNLEAVTRTLRERFAIRTFSGGGEALTALRAGYVPDLVITDQRMPHMSGVELLEEVRVLLPTCIRIILSGFTDRSDLLAAINRGAVDHYLTKPWHASELLATVEHALANYGARLERTTLEERLVRTAQAASDAVEARSPEAGAIRSALGRLRELSQADALTRAFNYRYLQDNLSVQLERTRALSAPLSLVLADVDAFHAFNQAKGRQAADEVLCHVADVLLAAVHEPEFAARIGGDEFVVVLPHVGEEDARRWAETVQGQLHKQLALACGTPPTVSLGVVSLAPGAALPDAVALLNEASAACAEGKRSGARFCQRVLA